MGIGTPEPSYLLDVTKNSNGSTNTINIGNGTSPTLTVELGCGTNSTSGTIYIGRTTTPTLLVAIGTGNYTTQSVVNIIAAGSTNVSIVRINDSSCSTSSLVEMNTGSSPLSTVTIGPNGTSSTLSSNYVGATNIVTLRGALTFPIPASSGEANAYSVCSISRVGIQLTSNSQAMTTTTGGATITGTWTYWAQKTGCVVTLNIKSGTFTTTGSPYYANFTFPTALIPRDNNNTIPFVLRGNVQQVAALEFGSTYGASSTYGFRVGPALSGVMGQFWTASDNQVYQMTLQYVCKDTSSL